MLAEHLLEPEALVLIAKTKRNYVDFIREFSKPSPRVISNFPKGKKIKKLALNAQPQDVSEIEQLRLVELIQFINERNHVDRQSTYDGAVSSFDNLQRAATEIRTDYIFLDSSKRKLDCLATILGVDQFESGIVSLPTQQTVVKTAQSMSEAMSNLLRLSSNICFVDPYFNHRAGMWGPLVQFVKQAISDTPNNSKHIQILFDGSKNRATTPKFLLNKFQKEEPKLLKEISTLCFKDIREIKGGEALHNRYIITDLAAVSFGIGLDESNKNEEDDVMLLSEELYLKRYQQYVELRSFYLEEEVISSLE